MNVHFAVHVIQTNINMLIKSRQPISDTNKTKSTKAPEIANYNNINSKQLSNQKLNENNRINIVVIIGNVQIPI